MYSVTINECTRLSRLLHATKASRSTAIRPLLCSLPKRPNGREKKDTWRARYWGYNNPSTYTKTSSGNWQQALPFFTPITLPQVKSRHYDFKLERQRQFTHIGQCCRKRAAYAAVFVCFSYHQHLTGLSAWWCKHGSSRIVVAQTWANSRLSCIKMKSNAITVIFNIDHHPCRIYRFACCMGMPRFFVPSFFSADARFFSCLSAIAVSWLLSWVCVWTPCVFFGVLLKFSFWAAFCNHGSSGHARRICAILTAECWREILPGIRQGPLLYSARRTLPQPQPIGWM